MARGITSYPQAAVCTMAAALVTLVGIPAAGMVARESGEKDPGFVVIDEVAGQLLALVFAPLRWQYLLASFILFRAFDILKPPPIGSLESLPQGYGIMLDDLAAGGYALILILVGARFQVLGS